MAALVTDERCLVLINKTCFDLCKTQQAIVQEQLLHLQLMEPHVIEVSGFFSKNRESVPDELKFMQ